MAGHSTHEFVFPSYTLSSAAHNYVPGNTKQVSCFTKPPNYLLWNYTIAQSASI